MRCKDYHFQFCVVAAAAATAAAIEPTLAIGFFCDHKNPARVD